jgi:hypothetical protein
LVRVPKKALSNEPTNQLSTAAVMTNGVQTKRPASRYFLIGMKTLVVLKNQWHAQPVAQPPEAAGAAGLLEAVSALLLAAVLSLAVEAAAVPAAAAGADVPPVPPLKSVAYQPEPLS